MSKQVEVPEGAVKAFRQAMPIEDFMLRDEEIALSLRAALPSIYKHFSDRLLSDEVIHELTKQIVEGSDGEVISLPYQVVEDALRDVLTQGEAEGHDFRLVESCPTCGQAIPEPSALQAASTPETPAALVLAVGLEEAKERRICPVCEGYGGGDAPEGHENSTCAGVCPECWCPGCHEGHDFPESRIGELDDGDPCGSWLAYELIHGPSTPEVDRG
ncbi:MAG TPA: hypothetical protein VGC63_04750 [Solirubrobacterales bacterium]|jgi:hypothetical protein